ncbi:MAG: CBS domain-containing protein [archaeon]|nr:CBS domain-containing protein [archaeon]
MSATKEEPGSIHVSDVMSYNILTVRADEKVSTAVSRLLKHGVGSVLVMDKNDQLVGIITKGDVLREVVMKHLDPNLVKSKAIMSEPVITIDVDSSLEAASRLMIQKKVSKLAVLNDGNLKGIITSTDIIRAEPFEVRYLEELVRARFVPRDLRS